MTFQKSLLYVALIFTSCQLYGQSKKEQLLALEQRNDSLQLVLETRQKELKLLEQELAQQSELKNNLNTSIDQFGSELSFVEKQYAENNTALNASNEKNALLKQLVQKNEPAKDSLGFFFIPIENVSFRNEQITVLQYDKEKSVLTYASGNLSDKVYDLSSWTYINSDDIEFQQNKLKQACSCQVVLPTLYDIMKLSQLSIPEEIIQNGVIYTSEGTLYLDTSITFTMRFKSFEPGKPKNKSGYVFFLKTIQL